MMLIEQPSIQVIAMSGSLRRGSYNMAALPAARELQPEGMPIEVADISGIPAFNEDTEAAGLPASVADLRLRVAAADAVLLSTPEYNYSIPGLLKNTIDWLSRKDRKKPADQSPINAKPLAITGVSTGRFGTTRAQRHLRDVCVYTKMLPLHRPEVLIGSAREKFDAEGRLTDEATKQFVRELLSELLIWARQIRTVQLKKEQIA